jgi:hypothetical protein
MLFAVTDLLLPSRLQSPSLYPVETIAAPGRLAVRRAWEAVELSGIEPLSEAPVWIT